MKCVEKLFLIFRRASVVKCRRGYNTVFEFGCNNFKQGMVLNNGVKEDVPPKPTGPTTKELGPLRKPNYPLYEAEFTVTPDIPQPNCYTGRI